MKYELDIHCHTISSGHAYSTLEENVCAAAEKKLKLLAITDHAPSMPGGAHLYHFYNLRIIPDYMEGVRIIKGAEANIIDYNGAIDLDGEVMENLEMVIASLHPPCLEYGSESQITKSLLGAMANKKINIIGHPGDMRYPFCINEVVAAAKESGTLLEINNSSLMPTSFRPGGDKMVRQIIEESITQKNPLIMGSDAHISTDVGNFTQAAKILVEMGFPQKDIINSSVDRFLEYIRKDRVAGLL